MKQIQKSLAKMIWILLSFISGSFTGIAGESEVGEIDSVLDRLEKKLDDQRSEVLEPYRVVKKKQKNMGESYSSEPVSGNLEELKKIRALSEEVNRLDSDLKSLTEKVNIQAMALTEDSKVLPRATILYQGLQDQNIRPKYLRFLLNDVPLFEYKISQSSAHLPLSFKIYEGALPQGKHTLKVEGVWGGSSSKLLADEDISWRFEKNYEIQSDGQAVSKQYNLVAEFASPSKKMEISLKTGDVR